MAELRDEQTFEQRVHHTRKAAEQALVELFAGVHNLPPDQVRESVESIMDECESRLMMIIKDERRRLFDRVDRAIEH